MKIAKIDLHEIPKAMDAHSRFSDFQRFFSKRMDQKRCNFFMLVKNHRVSAVFHFDEFRMRDETVQVASRGHRENFIVQALHDGDRNFNFPEFSGPGIPVDGKGFFRVGVQVPIDERLAKYKKTYLQVKAIEQAVIL